MTYALNDARALRARFIDPYVREQPRRTLDVVAHMLFELDRIDRLIDVGLDYLAERLNAGRVDIGWGRPHDRNFVPARQVCRGGRWSSVVDQPLPNRHAVLQRVWRRADPVAYENVHRNLELGSLRTGFVQGGARAMLALSLRADAGAFAIVCVDDMETDRTWSAHDRSAMTDFCRRFFGPILHLSREVRTPSNGSKPSPAELSAVRLAAEGASYKEIADKLGKSVRTVEYQLRSARRKTGAANQADLVLRCQAWL